MPRRSHQHLILFFLHGFGTNGEIWEKQKVFLSPHYQLLIPNLDLSQLDAEATRLANLCQEENFTETVMIAWSMGGFLALKIYELIPKMIKSLILISVTPKFIQDETFPYGLSLALMRNLERKLQKDYFQGMNFFYDLIFNHLEKPKGEIKGLNPPEYEKGMKCLEELKNCDLRDLLPKILIPTLIIQGEKDQICSLSTAQYLKNRIPQSQLVVFENEGHTPFVTQPEKFNQTVKDFLVRVP